MPLRGDICEHFNSTMFRYFFRNQKKYKRFESFAKRMGVGVSTVYTWHSGSRKPTWKNLIKMAWVLKITPHQLLTARGRHELNRFEDHLIDYLEAPPEIAHEKIVAITDKDGNTTKTKTVERELKLTTREAIDITERLGYFENAVDAEEVDAHSQDVQERIRALKNPSGSDTRLAQLRANTEFVNDADEGSDDDTEP